ncbi:MAG: polyprenyl synthetase family protein [Thermoguttaceae bacterium]|nr:polyprenyl synthetase family protein [Thermoguttaceae bacterium]MDW8077877.1 polyprenyl synthetase family protein [Thermoguttaceae bacterium]
MTAGEAPPNLSSERCQHRAPPDRAVRELIRSQAELAVHHIPTGQWFSRRLLEELAQQILSQNGLPRDWMGWTMVAIASAYWRPQIMGVPFSRRLVLLPHCMRSSGRCPASYEADGLRCRRCGACPIGSLASEAEALGCQVLVAEGSPAVVRMILDGAADAVLGVACLASLEKVFDRLVAAGMPGMAVPLVVDGCRDTVSDVDWIWEMIRTPYTGRGIFHPSLVPLLRAVHSMFRAERLARIFEAAGCPIVRGPEELQGLDGRPVADLAPEDATRRIAWDFVLKGGKHFRPLLVAGAYDAATGGQAVGQGGEAAIAAWPGAVWTVAAAVEVFHKASLVHDDIEDGDLERYGAPTVHARFGVPMAINVGDYLIGIGYRLLGSLAGAVEKDVAVDILQMFTAAHLKLCQGQGAELAWRDRLEGFADPLLALRIYARKTAPALEAALQAGFRLAGRLPISYEVVSQLCRHLGIAYQIVNDLEDWEEKTNARRPGGDACGLRPTVLWALAASVSGPADTSRRLALWRKVAGRPELMAEVESWFRQTGAFDSARELVNKHRARIRQLAEQIPQPLVRDFLLRVEEILLG